MRRLAAALAAIGCDSLAFISLKGLHEAVRAEHAGFCDACFSGDFPVAIPEPLRRKAFKATS